MKIGIDFDGTITRDPNMWLALMLTMRDRFRCEVFIVTWRFDHEWPYHFDMFTEHGFKVYFTGRQAKKTYMENAGIWIDIWIDDNPAAIIMSQEEFLSTKLPAITNSVVD